MLTDKTLGVIGAGNMAEALIMGIIKAKMIPAGNILACDPSEERRQRFEGQGCRVGTENKEAAACDLLLLSVKPQCMQNALAQIAGCGGPNLLVISIAAGIRTASIAAQFPAGTRIVRVMPNTPMLAGAGMSGVARGSNATDEDLQTVLDICAAAGEACEVPESLLDAVTAVSGSGPAYVFFFTEMLARAAEEVGMDKAMAHKFAKQTVIGSATLLATSTDEPETLRRKVTSPGGTTEAAIKSMLQDDLPRVLSHAVRAARDRSVELSGNA